MNINDLTYLEDISEEKSLIKGSSSLLKRFDLSAYGIDLDIFFSSNFFDGIKFSKPSKKKKTGKKTKTVRKTLKRGGIFAKGKATGQTAKVNLVAYTSK